MRSYWRKEALKKFLRASYISENFLATFSLGDHFESFIDQQLASGRYGSASEVIRASLRLLEEHEHKIEGLRKALLDGERSADVG